MTRLSRRRKGKGRSSKPESSPSASEPRLGPRRRVVFAAIPLAVVAGVVAFSLYRYYKIEEPARALERWAEATRTGDCDGSYEGLSSAVKEVSVVGDKENWCQIIGSSQFIGTVSVERTYRSGSKACVVARITESDESTHIKPFILVAEGGAWKIDLGATPESAGIEGCPSL